MADALTSLALNDVQQRALDSLHADGIAVLRFQDLFGSQLWGELAADIEPFVRQAAEWAQRLGDTPEEKEDVIVRRFFKGQLARKKLTTFSLESPWLRYAASPVLLDVVNAYAPEQRRLFYIDNWFTVPYHGVSERVASQRWHRDAEDEHVVKVFVYFSDVDEEAGPFEYVRSSAAGGELGTLWSWADGLRYPPADEFETAVPTADRLTLTGPAGTMIICDTGGFHRGGFARTKARVLSVSSYLPVERREGMRRFKVDLAGEEALPPQMRFALTA
jgi:hypothetical protein